MLLRASLKRLRLSNFKLNVLLEITQAINENLPTEGLLKRYEKILKDELSIGKILIFKFNKKWDCVLSSGFNSALACDFNVEANLLSIKEISNISKPSTIALLNQFDTVIPVFHKNIALAYILIGDIDEEREGMSPTIKHLHFIQTLTNIIIVAIENKRLFKENLRQEAIRKELELASKMQEMLIPNSSDLPRNDKLYVDTHYHPHFEVGGDYYDFVQLNKDEVGFCIADVSGKGISAAILMSNFQANLRALFTSEISLTELVRRLNYIVVQNTKGEKFITLFIAKYNCVTNVLNYINAGHNPPVFFNNKLSSASYLKNGCVGLGMMDEIPEVNKGSIKVNSNSKLLCYTDGLVEVENEENIEFGTLPLENAISNDERIDENIRNLIEKINIYKGDRPFFDDISIIGIEFY